jgi:hypothetical protein
MRKKMSMMELFFREMALDFAVDLKQRIESGEIKDTYVPPNHSFGYRTDNYLNQLVVQDMIKEQESLFYDVYQKYGMKYLDRYIEIQKEKIEELKNKEKN